MPPPLKSCTTSDLRMSLICAVRKDSSTLVVPSTAPTRSKYPTPLVNSSTLVSGRSAAGPAAILVSTMSPHRTRVLAFICYLLG